MALDDDKKPKGNPNWIKGKPTNPKGKLKGTLSRWNTKVIGTLQRLRRNPVEELISLADLAKANKDYELASQIWKELQQYREPKRKPVEVYEAPQTPEESKENVEAALKLLEEMSDGRESKESSHSPELAAGAPQLAPEASSKSDVRGDSPE